MVVQERSSGESVTTAPEVSNWYVSRLGRLLKVRMILLADAVPATVMIEYLDGSRYTISINTWNRLGLISYALGEQIKECLDV